MGKRWRYRFAVKTFAVLLAGVLFALTVFSGLGILAVSILGGYTGGVEQMKTALTREYLEGDTRFLLELYLSEEPVDRYYGYGDLYFRLYDENGELLLEAVDEEAKILRTHRDRQGITVSTQLWENILPKEEIFYLSF